MVDLSRFMIAAVAVLLLYLCAGALLLHLVIVRLRRRSGAPETETEASGSQPVRRSRRGRGARLLWWSRAVIFALAAAGPLCFAWARLVEPYWPAVERVRLVSPKIPAGARPVRLVLLADTHSDPVVRLERRLPDLVAELKPDLIVFTGDALNSRGGLPHFRELMTRLAGVAPTFAVRGNWDVWYFGGTDLFGGTGVEVLNGEAVPVRVGGTEIRLVGAAVENESALAAALAALPPDRFVVLLHHYPETGAGALERGADLALAGDTHGGQVRLPLLGALVRISRWGRTMRPASTGSAAARSTSAGASGWRAAPRRGCASSAGRR